MQVWKVEITAGSGVTLLPRGAKPLSIHVQRGTPYLWLLVDPAAPKEEREFIIVGTGQDVPDGVGDFVGTFLVAGDSLVFHVFEAA